MVQLDGKGAVAHRILISWFIRPFLHDFKIIDTMLRLLSTQSFYELWKYNRSVAYCVIKAKSVFPINITSRCRPINVVRHCRTGIQLWKDGLQPKSDESKELEEIDLDKWKTVMRSKMVEKANDINQGEEASDDEENLQATEVDLKGTTLLEATRELVAMWRYAGKLVPQEMTDEEIRVLAELSTKSSKKKYLKYLAIKEGHKRNRKEKQQRTKTEKEAAKQSNEQSICEEEPDQNGAGAKNTFLMQFWNRSLDKLLGWRCAQAMMFDQPLVFDMSYESNMSRREIDNTVSQLMEVEGWNRRATEPFHLHFCNLQHDGAYMQEFLKRYGAETWSRLFVTCTDQQHIQVFPQEQLVYLTADSPNVLRTFDHSKVYIIGALVDRSIQSGLSLANAKRLKLATARLPLNEFLHWETGAKNLTLDQMIRIMLTLKERGKWEEALKFVPQRKHDGFTHQYTQKEVIHSKAKGVTKEKGTWLKSGKQMYKNEDQNQFGITSKDRMVGRPGDRGKSALTRLRTSFRSNMEGKNGKNKIWWDDD